MSGFSFNDITGLGVIGQESMNNSIKAGFAGDVIRVNNGEALQERAESHNDYFMGSGTHEGFSLTKPLSTLWGAPGATVTRIVNIKSHSCLNGLFFTQRNDPSNVSHLIKISNNARVTFNNCIFQRKYNAPIEVPAPTTTKCFVLVESGSSATFSGCIFRSSHITGAMNGVGTVVQNANAAAAPALGPIPGVYIIGGSNMTTHSHGLTVTRIGGEV